MTPVLAGMTAAVSRDLNHLMHTWVYVQGHGHVWINDRTNKRFRNTLDVAVDSRETALEIGRTQRKVSR